MSAAEKTVDFGSSSNNDALSTTQRKMKKKEAKNKKSGGFQSMGFSPPVFNAIKKLGYKLPTPVQRKAIPEILAGHDVVAMARTGSGKTAAFLLPIVERLQSHSAAVGVRAVILSPTRELAMQTHKVTKQVMAFTDLRVCLLVGGASMENQFEQLANNPDIIIATPGRLMHHLVEVQMSLKAVEFAVFDEADRLFEMGFAAQLREIMKAMEGSSGRRQTLLFSATMPSVLAEFARAGLREPKIVRLDVENKISPLLKISFLTVRKDDKPAALLYLLKKVIPSNQQTIVFASTRHHVEFLSLLLTRAGIECAPVYGTMDATARKLNVSKFRARKAAVLVVTDIAARGIDIPLLDNVVNYDMASKPKLFVHRVGRVARAGRAGCSYSFVAPDELAYMVDLHLFLGRKMQNVAITMKPSAHSADEDEDNDDGREPASAPQAGSLSGEQQQTSTLNGSAAAKKPSKVPVIGAGQSAKKKKKRGQADADDPYKETNKRLVQDALAELMRDFAPASANNANDSSGASSSDVQLTDEVYYGSFPRGALEDDINYVATLLASDHELANQYEVANRAYKLYTTTRPSASGSSVKRAKELASADIAPHPMFGVDTSGEQDLNDMLRSISTFKPKATIFEIVERKNDVMRVKRAEHDGVIARKAHLSEVTQSRAALMDHDDGESQEQQPGGMEDSADEDGNDGALFAEPKVARETASTANENSAASKTQSRKRKKPTLAAGAYRDERFYIRSTPTPEALQQQKDDRAYSVNDRDSLASLGGGLDTMVLDVAADETDALRKQHQQTLWDRKKKKFVVVGKDTGIKVRNEAGKIVRSGGDKVKKTDLYEQWKKKKRKVIPTAGDESFGDDVQDHADGDTSGAGRKRSRFASDDLDSEPGGKRPRQQSTSPRGGKGKGRVPNANAKRELRSPEQVRKERTQKALKGAKHRRGGSAGRGRGRGKR